MKDIKYLKHSTSAHQFSSQGIYISFDFPLQCSCLDNSSEYAYVFCICLNHRCVIKLVKVFKCMLTNYSVFFLNATQFFFRFLLICLYFVFFFGCCTTVQVQVSEQIPFLKWPGVICLTLSHPMKQGTSRMSGAHCIPHRERKVGSFSCYERVNHDYEISELSFSLVTALGIWMNVDRESCIERSKYYKNMRS